MPRTGLLVWACQQSDEHDEHDHYVVSSRLRGLVHCPGRDAHGYLRPVAGGRD